MRSVLFLVGVVAIGFLWKSPAHDVLVQKASRGIEATKNFLLSQRTPLTAQLHSLSVVAREKTMELLREELHRVVDDTVH